MAVFSVMVGIAILVLSLLFWIGKVPKSIINFDKIQQEEQGRLNQKALGRNLSLVLLLLAIIFIITGFSPVFKEKYFIIAVLVWVVVVFLDIWFIGKSSRYLKK